MVQILRTNEIKSRGWCFTINNWIEEEKVRISSEIASAKYGIAEIEHSGEGQGTPHIQGYIYWNNVKSFREAKRRLGERAHIEAAKGSPEQNYDYCSKEGTVFAQKPLPKKGLKWCFLEMWNDMNTLTTNEFRDKYPKEWYVHREKVLQVMIDSAMKSVRDFNGDLGDKNVWIWGEPGVGKSRWACSNGTYNEILKKNFNKWWDGYNLLETKIVIIEDYPCLPQGNLLIQHMKIWGDRYPFEGECKGSHLMVEPRRFFLIITSNFPITECFENEEDQKAIKRRFKEIHCEQGDMFSQCMIKLERQIIESN